MTYSDKEMKELGLGQVLCRGYCLPKATPVNGECKPYVLKARHILVKFWLCLLLVYEQDKAAS